MQTPNQEILNDIWLMELPRKYRKQPQKMEKTNQSGTCWISGKTLPQDHWCLQYRYQCLTLHHTSSSCTAVDTDVTESKVPSLSSLLQCLWNLPYHYCHKNVPTVHFSVLFVLGLQLENLPAWPIQPGIMKIPNIENVLNIWRTCWCWSVEGCSTVEWGEREKISMTIYLFGCPSVTAPFCMALASSMWSIVQLCLTYLNIQTTAFERIKLSIDSLFVQHKI